ncbi:copper amine oxidase N-terminal domain-containing protein [Paenibacillus sonchi]|uniref:copper amine oxidase N-terminal domain-containing protein n=1 Tax=Paenibacillus sonchi TaxID=373687 RepID=UPI001E489E01|nr:copper amine oxidase N-terminal domain-containing protein [Paenibacillus sonchi]
MSKAKIPAAALLLLMLIGIAPLTASAPLSASASTINDSIKVPTMDVKMVFDGVTIQPPAGQYVFMYNNTTYVPLRFMSYALQKSVSWDAKNVKVTVAEPSSSELVVIKEYLMNAGSGSSAATASKNIVLGKVKASYVFSGSAKAVPSGQGSYLLNGSLYVPLRFLSESVGNSISWDQKNKTITASSPAYDEQKPQATPAVTGNTPNSPVPSAAAATPAPSSGTAAGGGSAGNGKVTYEQITGDTEAKLNALRDQSTSTLMGLAIEYVNAKDDAAKKAGLIAKGKQQLASFTASFNSIIADAEQKLNSNGYSTDIIKQYRATFEAELQKGMALAEGMAG